MKNYVINGNVIEVKLANNKVVKIDKKWADETMKTLDISFEDTLQMYLEDEGYIINQEQEELNTKAKGVVKPQAGDKTKRKPREKVQKENPTKEMIIAEIAKTLQNLGVGDLKIENKTKIITFSYKMESFKVDLIQRRKKKA